MTTEPTFFLCAGTLPRSRSSGGAGDGVPKCLSKTITIRGRPTAQVPELKNFAGRTRELWTMHLIVCLWKGTAVSMVNQIIQEIGAQERIGIPVSWQSNGCA